MKNSSDSETKKSSYFELELENPQPDSNSKEELSVTVLKAVKLNPGISSINFFCALIYSLIMTFGFTSTAQLQPLILLDKDYYNIGQDNAGSIVSLVLVVQLSVKILVSIPYGHFADKFGRKFVIIYGAVNCLACCILVPLQNTFFPGFVTAKALLTNGATAFGSVPLLADYVSDESKGKAMGLAGMFIGVGAISSNLFIKALLSANFTLGTCYYVIGGIVFGGMLLVTLGLKGGKYYTSKHIQIPEGMSMIKNLKQAIDVFKVNGWLRISLVLQILGNSDFLVFIAFMTLYVKSLYPSGSESSAANIMATNLNALVQISSFLCNMVYGFYLDKFSKTIVIPLIALTGGIMGLLLMSSCNSSSDWTLYLSAIIIGMTIHELSIIAGYLSIKNYPPDKRGIMSGFNALVGNIGYFLITTVSGFLYDNWRKDGPFLLCATLLGIAIILVIKIYRNIVKDKELDHRNEDKDEIKFDE